MFMAITGISPTVTSPLTTPKDRHPQQVTQCPSMLALGACAAMARSIVVRSLRANPPVSVVGIL